MTTTDPTAEPAPSARTGDGATVAAPVAVLAPVSPLTHKQILLVLSGIMTGQMLAALDGTLVATALPTIVGEFGGLSELSWVVTAYLLTSTVSIPLYGKISDLYGRKRLFQAAVIIFVIGSILSGFAQSMGQLIAFRALQGIGAGGLMSMSHAILGDIVSPRHRGRYQGYMGSVFAFASVIGPFTGGFFVDHLTWRWAFYINLPIGIAALIVTSSVLNLEFRRVRHRIDFVGAGLIMLGAGSLLFMAVWGGETYAWGSPQIIGLAVVAAVALTSFFVQERRAVEPIIPLRLWRNPVFAIVTVLEFIIGLGLFTTIIFLPLYLQTVGQASATNSGLLILPLLVTMMATTISVGHIISRTGRYKVFPVVGSALAIIGVFCFSTMGVGTSHWQPPLFMVIFGLAAGCVFPVTVLSAQNAVEHRDLGTATGVMTFSRSMGGSFGVALFGALLSSQLAHHLTRLLPAAAAKGLDPRTLASSPAVIKQLAPDIQAGVIEALARSIHTAFLLAVPLMVICFIAALFLREVPLRDTVHVGSTDVLV